MEKNTIIVCGGSGLVGRTLIDSLIKNNINVIGTYNKNKINNKLININFEDIDIFEQKLLEIKPNFCISCIAERQNEICENNWDEIKKINVDIVNNIALICNKHNIFLIHLSTDYVYDGLNPPFNPSSLTNPLQNYGISKLISEKRILSAFKNNNFLIIRVPVLYSNNIKNLSESAVSLIIKKVMNKVEKFNEDNFSVRRPVFIDDLCEFIIVCINNKKLTGIHCFYNPFEKFTKYEIANIGAKILNKNIFNIVPINNKPIFDKALRPIDTELFDDDIHANIINGKFKITLLEEGLNKTLSKFIHPKINFNDIDVDKNKFFFLLDLDGTLVDSEIVQWKSYRDALKDFNIDYTFDEFTSICHNGDIKKYLIEKFNFTNEMYLAMKNNKKKCMLNYETELKLIEGADMFINYLNNNNINYAVVTNSSIDTVDIYKKAIPKLNELSNWVIREDYIHAKPSPECFNLAILRYYKNEEFIIGFENSLSGLESIKNVTNIVYFLTYKEYLFYDKIQKEDIFLIKNFYDIFQ